jgi:hypothetical protein
MSATVSILSLTTLELAQAAAKGDTNALAELRRRLAKREANPAKAGGCHANAKITQHLRDACANPAQFVAMSLTAQLTAAQKPAKAAKPAQAVAFARKAASVPATVGRDSLKRVRADMDARFTSIESHLMQQGTVLVAIATKLGVA